MHRVGISLLALAAACAAQQAALKSGAVGFGFEARRVEAHVRALASDDMAGRDTGSASALAAARTIAAVFEQAGLRPAGDEGGWLQDIGMAGWAIADTSGVELVAPDGTATSLEYGTDWTYLRGGPLVADLGLKVVRSPEEWSGPSGQDEAVLVVGSHPALLRRFFVGKPPESGAIVLALPDAPGQAGPLPARLLGGAGGVPVLMLRGASATAAEADGARLRICLEGTDPVPAVNVVGVLPGVGSSARPELAQQAIVFTAHYDHLGVEGGTAGEGVDRIYNGADDDASGVAAVMALAQAFGAGPAPSRTLVFLAVTGEERGLLGTRYYLEHPVVPLERTVCNLNFEMIGRPDETVGGPGHLWLTGYERTNLGAAWTRADLAIAPDGRPEQHFFERSDNFAFARRGIVAQTLSSYNLHSDYHTPADEPDTLDYDHMARAIEESYRAARLLADGRLSPRWKKDGRP